MIEAQHQGGLPHQPCQQLENGGSKGFSTHCPRLWPKYETGKRALARELYAALGAVFRSKNGTPWIGDEVVKDKLKPLLQQLGIKQGVEGVGLHAFRHGNPTLMDVERTPLKVRQDRLGHVDGEEITLGIYTHAESDDHQAVAEKLGNLLAPVEEELLEKMKPASNHRM